MRFTRLIAAALAALTFASPALADQILGQGRIDGTGHVVLPGGPTLGQWQAGKFTATPDAVQIKGSGSTGDVSGTSAAATGGVLRTLAERQIDTVNIKDWGAKGDGEVDDTDAWRKAQARAVALGRAVLFPAGTYLIAMIDMRDRAQVVPLIAQGRVVIAKATNDGLPLMQINDGAQANAGYVAPTTVSGITFDARGKAAYAVLAYAPARWKFPGCRFLNATTAGYMQYGGAQTALDSVDAQGNGQYGIAFDRYAYGYPNLNRIDNSGVFDNGKAGIYFDGGRMLAITATDIEGNGKAGDATSGGIVVGTSVGVESGSAPQPGVTVTGGWIEGNRGSGGAIVLGSGHNRIVAAHMVANGTPADVLSTGGTYDISHTTFTGQRTHVQDTAGTGYGNTLTDNRYGGSNAIDPAKTAMSGSADAWTSFTPTLSADGGRIGSTAWALGAYQRVGKTIHVRLSVGIGAAGSATGDLLIGNLPVPAKGDTSAPGLAGAGFATTGVVQNNQTFVRQRKYDGTSLIAANASVVLTFSYESAN